MIRVIILQGFRPPDGGGKVQIRNDQGNALVKEGYDVVPGDWPWHAALYHVNLNDE